MVYEDIEKTPATKVPYRIVFSDGEERTGVLDDKGLAVETGVPAGGGTIEFCYADDESALESELTSLYGELGDAVQQSAVDMGDFYRGLLASMPPPDLTDEKTKALRENLKRAAEAEIAEIKARADEFDALPSYQAAWENAKAAANGVGKGVTEYIPDLGEFGALMDVIDIDITVMVEAIYTGDISDLQKQFQAWENRGAAGYESATESMEVLILLLSDKKTREILLSLPQRFFEVMPEDELIEIGIAQGTQAGMDVGAVAVTTIAVGAVTGPGGAIAGAAVAGATTVRKGAKALEGMTDVLTKLIDVLKKTRNKKTHGTIEKNKTEVPKDKRVDEKVTKNCKLCKREIKRDAKPNDRKYCRGAKERKNKEEAIEGDSKKLSKYILSKSWYGAYINHPWCDSRNKNSGNLQAHHIITTDSVSSSDWQKYRQRFSYDINEFQNGVFLPSATDVACQLGVSAHKGPHTKGLNYSKYNNVIKEGQDIPDEYDVLLIRDNVTYLEQIEQQLKDFQTEVIENGDLCQGIDSDEKFADEMRAISELILKKIDSFTWSISRFGKDYRKGVAIGCANNSTEGGEERTYALHFEAEL